MNFYSTYRDFRKAITPLGQALVERIFVTLDAAVAPLSVKELQALLDEPQAVVSGALAALRRVGLVDVSKSGRSRLYLLNREKAARMEKSMQELLKAPIDETKSGPQDCNCQCADDGKCTCSIVLREPLHNRGFHP